jgi:hypothetical protein
MTATYNTATPPRAGVYAVNGSKHDLRRHWAPATGFSAPFYADDPADIVERAMRTPADRELAAGIVWREVQPQHAAC